MEVVLLMLGTDGQIRKFPLKKPKNILGRATDCDLRIPLSTISRHHCLLEIRSDRVRLKDLGSSNGTRINGRKVMEVDLDAGDQINLGEIIFTLTVDGYPTRIKSGPVSGVNEENLADGASQTFG